MAWSKKLNQSSTLKDLDPSVSSASSASSSPFHPKDARILRDESRLAPSVLLSSPPSGDSSPSDTGSPSQRHSPRSITLEPPPLPFLSAHRTGESLISSPDNKRAESSVYYTTAWGSPYAAPSTRRLSLTLSQYAGADRESRESSPVSVANNPEFRRSSVVINEELVGSQEGRSIRDFTQDWINQYLTGQPRTERSNWLSDDSGSEAPSFFTAQNQLVDESSDDWLGLEDDIRESDLLKTPTLSDFVGRRAAARAKPKKNLHKRAETLRQEDFWGFAYDKESPNNTMSDTKESQPPAEVTSPAEKPLPPPPSSIEDENVKIEDTQKPDVLQRQASDLIQSATQIPRRRKKLAWRGKACIIEFPMDDKRGTEESDFRLLTREDVEARMKNWESEGYDIRGFTIGETDGSSEPTELGGLSRPLYPDPYEVYEETKDQKVHISFPDKSVWDSYVANLQEEKLRALGVSFGDPEPQHSPSPASASINPSQTPFPGLVASPPIPTASAASNPLSSMHTFSPHFGQSASNASGGMGSLASPGSFGVHTPFMGIEQNLMNGYPFQFQPTPPAQGSMTPQSLANLRHVNSSVGPGALHNFNSMLSPVSPMHEQGYPDFEKAGFDPGFGLVGHDAPPFQTPRTPVNDPGHFHANVEIAHPTPRGHGHNLSETLQRGVEQMTHPEYRGLPGQVEHHMEDDHDAAHHGMDFDSIQNRWERHQQENGFYQPQNDYQHMAQNAPRHASFSQHPHQFYDGQFGHQMQNTHEVSDVDTNPSLAGTPHTRSAMPNQGPWHESKPSSGSYQGHQSKLSISSLNVQAKEFDPTVSFESQAAQLGGNAFQFGGMGQQGFGFAPAASAFNPSASINAPLENPLKQSTSSFKFSSASFNVDAPVFNPSASIKSNASINSNASSEQPPANRAKIFGDIDIAEISKPTKENKAIPIVRPDENEAIEDENEQTVHDDANGRPVPTDRHKRARRGIGHAEGEARYSISTHPLGEAGNAQASNNLQSVAEGKENALPGDDKTLERRSTPLSEADTWTLFDYRNKSNAGSPIPDEHSHEIQEGSAHKPMIEEPAKEAAPQNDSKHAAQESKSSIKSTMLSATAAPFEFKPVVPAFVPITVQPSNFAEKQLETEPEPTKIQPAAEEPLQQKSAEKKSGGLMASRFATDSPPKPLPAASQQNRGWNSDSGDETPDSEDIDAVMDQLNGDGSDIGIERQYTPLPPQHFSESMGGPTKEQRFGSVEGRSEAPSPSPGGGQKTYKLDIPRLDFDEVRSHASPSPKKGFISPMNAQKGLITRFQSPTRRGSSPALSFQSPPHQNDEIEVWDTDFDPNEDEKLITNKAWAENRAKDVVHSVVYEQVAPLQRSMALMQATLASIANETTSRKGRRSMSAEVEDSDADDEDDDEREDKSVRARSPRQMRDRKLMQSVVMEALVALDLPGRSSQHSSHGEMAQLKESIAELQAFVIKKLAQDPVGDMEEILQETLARQFAQQTPRLTEAEEIGADSLMLQIEGLKSMLRMADERAEQEYKTRRDTQDSLAELQHLLKAAEEDAARHSAAAEDAEARLLQFKEEKIPHLEKMQFRSTSLAEESETLKVTIAELSSKNIALEGTLDEYRVSSDHFRRQLETAKDENKSLHETVDHLRTRIEDSMVARQNLGEKFDRLQSDMVTLTSDVISEQASWRRKEEEQTAKHNELLASHAREVKLREQLEQEVAELAKQEREAAKMKFVHEQSQQENARLEEVIANLRAENHELSLTSARFEREFNEARESSRMEIQRTRTSMEADLEASNVQVNIVRAELEAQVIRLQSQLENVQMDADTSRERYEMLLEEAKESKITAVATAKESRETALEDERKTHERVLNDLRERHARALHNSSEDRQRADAYMEERMALADDRAKHLQERVEHLEERLEIAQSAARAAAEAAQKGGAYPVPAPAPAHSSSPSMSFNKGSQEPEKISPQALRESIFVLQDQLQQRETRIEELEQEVSSVDKEAPNKIKERDTEITWLRELLGVRIDDLQDIIKTLSQPSFNQHAVRDAAIRLKANLQMQQQERERAVSGQSLQLPSISDIAASPRALPLAAAAAWGNWRKSRENSNGAGSAEQTPSKSSNAGTFLSGLLTPPTSNVRPNATQASASGRSYSEGRPLRGFNSTPRRGSVRQEALIAEPPKTPPLLRRSSYDHDAEATNYEDNSFATDDIESTVDGMVSESPRDLSGPFGPQISAVAEDEE
ncbi:uncharacterized protein N7443_000972 [Penicillium atrosanguineum]|uniref:uncharacterized protein n=1 Tax=Penicillium atrosanguineum TaxID=1132637 RepID=UPI00238F2087|nr:uncharacterized protein N7443_000972 [Penicillium atrosanguineum]KAJ5314088.1 hypothetical protein N7443_000972 [Penicillium atrosanguineum]